MDLYYIINSKGESLFLQPYCKDFCIHCLVMLLDTAPQETFSLLSASFELKLRSQKIKSGLSCLLDVTPAKATARNFKLRSELTSA